MAIERPDFANWTEEDFETRADEICEYFHSFDWLGRLPGPRHETYLELACKPSAPSRRLPRSAATRSPKPSAGRETKATSWERIGELLGTSAAEAERRYEVAVQAERGSHSSGVPT